MAGQRQKPRDELAFKRAGRADSKVAPIRERPADAVVDFTTPEGVTDEAALVWQEAVWLVKDHLVPSDMFRLRRYIYWVDRWVREMGKLESEDTITSGSLGQPVMNPRLRALALCEQQIVAAESVMGLNPQARMRLGINLQAGEKAWNDLKAKRGGAIKPAKRQA